MNALAKLTCELGVASSAVLGVWFFLGGNNQELRSLLFKLVFIYLRLQIKLRRLQLRYAVSQCVNRFYKLRNYIFKWRLLRVGTHSCLLLVTHKSKNRNTPNGQKLRHPVTKDEVNQ